MIPRDFREKLNIIINKICNKNNILIIDFRYSLDDNIKELRSKCYYKIHKEIRLTPEEIADYFKVDIKVIKRELSKHKPKKNKPNKIMEEDKIEEKKVSDYNTSDWIKLIPKEDRLIITLKLEKEKLTSLIEAINNLLKLYGNR